MSVKIEFETDNAAFEFRDEEIKRILHEIADHVPHMPMSGSIHDINGNQIGRYEITEA